MLITFPFMCYRDHSVSREIQGEVEGYEFKSEGKIIVFTDQNPIFLSCGLYTSLIGLVFFSKIVSFCLK